VKVGDWEGAAVVGVGAAKADLGETEFLAWMLGGSVEPGERP
jgi:hypothetical protein